VDKNNSHKLRSLPIQLIELNDAVLLKRGCTELKIIGEGGADVVHFILTVTSNGGASREDICQNVPIEQRPTMEQLIDHLRDRRLLVSSEDYVLPDQPFESHQDIFYWHFGVSLKNINFRLNSHSLAILGANYISLQLALSLSKSGWNNFHVFDDPRLRNLRLFDDSNRGNDEWPIHLFPLKDLDEDATGSNPTKAECIIACADFGNSPTIREWNGVAIQNSRRFFPVTLHNLIGYLGPLTIPGETACYECLRSRQNSHMNHPNIERTPENSAFEGQAVIGFHPCMASILGDLAALELVKVYAGALPSRNIGTLIEVNLLATKLTTRKILKVPRCLICSPLNDHSPADPYNQTVARAEQPNP
jgi:bacteriocin biosynthesis cyclodehydratase domain-containing protein